MLRVDDVPTWSGPPGPVWLARLPAVRSWHTLLVDTDWDRLVTRADRPFTLMTVSGEPRPHLEDWHALVEHCVGTTYLAGAHSWGPGSSVLDDLVDETWLARNDWEGEGGDWTGGRPPPLSTWDDESPLAESVGSFCGLDLGGDDGPRIVLVVDDAGATAYDDVVRSLRSMTA